MKFKETNLISQDELETQSEYSIVKMKANQRLQEFGLRDYLQSLDEEKTPDISSKIEEIKIEASGKNCTAPESAKIELAEKSEKLELKASTFVKTFPDFSSYLYAHLAKLKQSTEEDFSVELDKAMTTLTDSKGFNNSIAKGVILGVLNRELATKELPTLESLVRIVSEDEAKAKEVSLALSETDKQRLLELLPEEKRQAISLLFDISVSRVLDSAVIDKKESSERETVKKRIFSSLQSSLENDDPQHLIKTLTAVLSNLGGGDINNFLRTVIEDDLNSIASSENGIPRIIKTLLDDFDDYRANDTSFRFAVELDTNSRISRYIIKRLIDRGYIPKDVEQWYVEKSKTSTDTEAVFRAVAKDVGVIPDKAILDFFGDDSQWMEGKKVLSTVERVQKIKESQETFRNIPSYQDLIKHLGSDQRSAMLYFLLNGGKERFNLINNYDFAKFQEILNISNQLSVHEKPINDFSRSLARANMREHEIEIFLKKISEGSFPGRNKQTAEQVAHFSVSAQEEMLSANQELSSILGPTQLGVIIRYPAYRKHIDMLPINAQKEWKDRFSTGGSFEDRLTVIKEFELAYPEMKTKLLVEEGESWRFIFDKLIPELSLEAAITDGTQVSINGPELLPRLDSRKADIKRMKKELVAALKGENTNMKKLRGEMERKKKNKTALYEGVKAVSNEAKREEIIRKIEEIDKDIEDLEVRMVVQNEMKVSERYSHLSSEDRKELIESTARDVASIDDKKPAAILSYLLAHAVGEEVLTESDVELINEMESHLESPLTLIKDKLSFESKDRKEQSVMVSWVDKKERLMNVSRFADSKTCCFSSSKYEQVIAHQTANKIWVGSIIRDPLSFVLSIEEPLGQEQRHNLGFIFGSFATDADGLPAILLNGIYYGPGVGNKIQSGAIMDAVEKIFKDVPIKTIAMAHQHGGIVPKPDDYKEGNLPFVRLRAIDDSNGKPESKIYDDLNTGDDLNKIHNYQNLYYKKLE